MAAKIVWTPRVRADIKKIYIDIGRDHPESAEAYFHRFRAKTESLGEHPRVGRRHPEIFPTARMLVEVPFVILYETRPDDDGSDIHTVEIVRIVDGRRDLKSLR